MGINNYKEFYDLPERDLLNMLLINETEKKFYSASIFGMSLQKVITGEMLIDFLQVCKYKSFEENLQLYTK